jgi:hypothetical protein
MYAKIVKATKGMAQGQQWHNSIFLSLVTLVKHTFTVKCTYVGVRRPVERMYAKIVKATKGMAQGQQ